MTGHGASDRTMLIVTVLIMVKVMTMMKPMLMKMEMLMIVIKEIQARSSGYSARAYAD